MNTKGSINARLKVLEKRFPEKEEPYDLVDQCDFEDLLFMDYEEYRKVFAAWLMALYMEDEVSTVKMRTKIDELNEMLSPITTFSDFRLKEHEDLLVKAIVDWMEENGLEEVEERRLDVLKEKVDDFYKREWKP